MISKSKSRKLISNNKRRKDTSTTNMATIALQLQLMTSRRKISMALKRGDSYLGRQVNLPLMVMMTMIKMGTKVKTPSGKKQIKTMKMMSTI
jgi:hypothetical protein